VRHFMGRGQRGKAMFIAIDKLTAVRMYEKVQAYWQREITHLQDELATARHDWKKQRLAEQLTYMQATDMAVVVSQAQNELELFADKGSTSSRTGCGWSRKTWRRSSRTRTTHSASSLSAPCGSPASTCRVATPSTSTSRCATTP